MGLQARIVLYAPSEPAAQNATRAAFGRLNELEDIMSDYRGSSELMRLCARAGTGPVTVSRDLLDVLMRSQDMARRSDGAFDVTVGPMVALWRQTRKTGVMPSPSELADARQRVDWRSVVIDPGRRTVDLRKPGMRLDLGGIAKGYACSSALTELSRRGLRRAMVEMGGDIALGDPPPGSAGWRIEIPNAAGFAQIIQRLQRCAVSTSGDTEQHIVLGGLRYSHIVDPRTGLGLTSRIGVTVIARDGGLSDALSTAVSVLGEAEGRRLAASFPATRCFIRAALD